MCGWSWKGWARWRRRLCELPPPVIARSEATTRLRLLRKLRRAGSPPKLGERRRKQSSFLTGAKLDCFASLAMTETTQRHGLRQGSYRRPRWNTSPAPRFADEVWELGISG